MPCAIVDFSDLVSKSRSSYSIGEGGLSRPENRDVGSGWAEWAIVHLGFGRSVNPILNQSGQI